MKCAGARPSDTAATSAIGSRLNNRRATAYIRTASSAPTSTDIARTDVGLAGEATFNHNADAYTTLGCSHTLSCAWKYSGSL